MANQLKESKEISEKSIAPPSTTGNSLNTETTNTYLQKNKI